MDLRYHRSPTSGLPHIYDHGVREAEVEWILTHPGEEGPGTNGSRQAIGQTESGRYLRVVFVPDEGEDGIFVVTAYPLTGGALHAYRKRKRRRKQ